MTNPYATTLNSEITSEYIGTKPVMVVAGVLTLLSALTILLESFFIVLPIVYFLVTTIMETPGFTPSMISGWGYLTLGAFVFAAHWMILFGSISMWRRTNYRFAMVAVVLSIVPVLSPFYALGIPFGIWGVIANLRPSARAAFVTNRGVHNRVNRSGESGRI